MTTNNNATNDWQEDKQGSLGPKIELKRIINRALNYWYLIVLSLMIALSIAFVRNRYATRVYPVTASIIIRESQETSEAKLLYSNSILSNYRNYLNEPYILKSFPLIETTLEDLNFVVSFYKEGNVLTSDVYDFVPLEAYVINENGRKSASYSFTIVDENSYTIGGRNENGSAAMTYHFNDTISYDGITLLARLKTDREYKRFYGDPFVFSYQQPNAISNQYVSGLKVSWAEEGAGIMNLSIEGASPQKNIDFLRGLISNYQEYDLDKKSRTATGAIQFIDQQLVAYSDSLKKVELKLEVFKSNNVFTDLSSEANRLYSKLSVLEKEKSEIIIQRNYYQYLEEYISNSDPMDQAILPSSVGISDGILTGLVSKMIDLQLEIKLYMRNERGDNPLIAEKINRIKNLRKDIAALMLNQQSAEKLRLNYYDDQVKLLEKQINSLPDAERRLVGIQRNYSLLENLYLYLLQKRAEVSISKASTTSDIVVVNPPKREGGFTSPKIEQNYFIAVGLGLALPFIIFVLLELGNTRVQSREDVEQICTIPFIGGVGHKQSDDNLVVQRRPKSAVSESFRSLRSNLNYFTGNEDHKVFMVTSSVSGEGKTFTSLNLATVLALSNKKTLIIGADMRKPRIFSDLGLTNDVGLSSYLSGLAPLEEAVQKTNIDNLYMMSGGPVPPNPAELLLRPIMDKMMEELKLKFDFIILDTPPVALVTDAFVLSKYADHSLFLVRQNYTPRMVLHTIQDYYQDNRIQNISILLNDIYKSGLGYGYGYGYGYSYGYGYGYGYGNGYGYYDEGENHKEKPGFLAKLFKRT
ncbi:MAG: polysaccharide biosynthesis tyrosine autokinase [Cyclobacteriaceae bacterium]|nr:polysaccharide biosynthesis tyrosine autokinase [Cyclobacteriaceae bacterium]